MDRSGREIEVIHGGARRLAVSWINQPEEPPHRISFYRVLPGERCTLHVHTGKEESWLLVAGTGLVRIGDDLYEVSIGDALVTPAGTPHELVNTGKEPLLFVNLVRLTGGPVTTTELEAGR